MFALVPLAILAACSSFGQTTNAPGEEPAPEAGAPDVDDVAKPDAGGDGDAGPPPPIGTNPVGDDLTPGGDFESHTTDGCGPNFYASNDTTAIEENGGDNSSWDCSVCRDPAFDTFTFGARAFAAAVAYKSYRATAHVRGNDGAPETAVFTARVWDTNDLSTAVRPPPKSIPLVDNQAWQTLVYDFQVPATFVPNAKVDVYLELDGPYALPSPNCLDVDDFTVFELQ